MNYVLTDYIVGAMARAAYDKLGEGNYSGRIFDFAGVLASGESLLDCEGKLRSLLEETILFLLQIGQELPFISGIDLHRDGGHRPKGSLLETPPNLKSLVRSRKDETEREAIMLTLERTKWNRKEAARQLGINYKALLYKIHDYDLYRSR